MPRSSSDPVLAEHGAWEEFTGSELAHALAETRWETDAMLDLAWALTIKLPGTYAAFRSGTLRRSKVQIIARAVAALDPKLRQAGLDGDMDQLRARAF